MERFDFGFAPYKDLTASERQILQSAVQIVFFDDDVRIVNIGDKLDVLYVVIKGMVQELDAGGDVVALYHAQDSFGVRALFEENSSHGFVAAEQCLVYALDKAVVMRLVQSNDAFGAYFYGSIAERLAVSSRANDDPLGNVFCAKVFDAYRDACVWVAGDDTLSQVAAVMKKTKAKSVLLNHEQRVGLLTESVFRDVVAGGADVNDLAHRWATFDLVGVDVEQFLFDALLKMMHHRIQRLVVTQGVRVVGLLEQMDILAYLSNHSHLIAEELERADSLSLLSDIANRLTDSVASLHASGMQAVQLAQLMQVLNARLFEKAWQLIAPDEIVRGSCLLVMGSEGRGEQILKTDQDNALIVADDVDIGVVQTYAEQFSQVLMQFGYPPCQGGIMVSNPKWCQSLSDFLGTVANWCKNPSPEHLMDLAIFMDAKAVAGDERLLQRTKAHLKAHLDNDIGVQRAFALAVLQFDEHGRGFFAKMLGKKEKQLMDIKKMGIFPIVHGVRALSLRLGLDDKVGSFERLTMLGQQGVITPSLAKDTSEALAYLMNLRLKTHLHNHRYHLNQPPNQIDTEKLSTLERDLLKDALQVVRRFKHEICSQFGLNYG